MSNDQPATKPRASARRLIHARYALLLALGEYSLDEIPASDRDQLLADLAEWYANDPSSAVHGAAGWLLRQWNQDEVVQKIDQTPIAYSPDREWFTLAIEVTPRVPKEEEATAEDAEATQEPDPQEKPDAENSDAPEDAAVAATEAQEPTPPAKQTFYMTFIVFPAGEYQIGSLKDEPYHENDEDRHSVKITRPFALLDREITFAELIAFDPQYSEFMQQSNAKPEDAGFGPMWYDAVHFCHWLSEQRGDIEEAQQSYPAAELLDKDKYPRDPNKKANWAPFNWPVRLEARGFRLPTESEWEAACRKGTRTMYGQGSDVGLLGHYAWNQDSSGGHVHAPKTRLPGLRGLYDMHGNLYEWCHDWDGDFENRAGITDPHGSDEGSDRVLRGGSWGSVAASCRSADRGSLDPTDRGLSLGFRLALSPSSE